MRIQGGYCADGHRLHAEIEPAGSRWLPLPGRTSRWWYEIHCEEATHAYERGGSGGGFTLRSCYWRAGAALDDFELRWINQTITCDEEAG